MIHFHIYFNQLFSAVKKAFKCAIQCSEYTFWCIVASISSHLLCYSTQWQTTLCAFLFLAVSYRWDCQTFSIFLILLYSVTITQRYGSVCRLSDRIMSNKDIQLMGVSYVLVCWCSQVWDYEIIGSENRRAPAKRSYGMNERESHRCGRGKEMKQNRIKLQKGQGNINRVRRLNW